MSQESQQYPVPEAQPQPPFPQQAEPFAQQSQPFTQQAEPFAQQPQPFPQQAEPFPPHPQQSQQYPAAQQPYAGYPQQPQGQWAPMQQGYQGGYVAHGFPDGESRLSLNLWLSVFFSWIPALIYYSSDKGRDAVMDHYLKENLNFGLTRLVVALVMLLPVIGTTVAGLVGIGMFVLAIMNATRSPEAYRRGELRNFPLTIRFIK